MNKRPVKNRNPKKNGDPWTEFLAEIKAARTALKCPEGGTTEAWFRGHTRSNYSLTPSLFRGFNDPDHDSNWRKVFDLESDLFWEFAARARELHGVVDEDWDILFAMQHYGTPTRLLDWSESFAVALYFAVLGVDENGPIKNGLQQDDKKQWNVQPPCIWVLNPYLLNDDGRWVIEGGEPDMVHPPYLGWDEDEEEYYTYGDLLSFGKMDWEWPVAIYPRQRNARIHAQRAWFTIHGDRFKAMDEAPRRGAFLRQITLPFAVVAAAKQFLELAGINHYLLFADLESLSLHLQEKNGLITRAQAEAKAKMRIDRRDIAPDLET